MCGTLMPYAAVRSDASMAVRVKRARRGARMRGWERVCVLVRAAW
jgi:hypothetical protein